MGDDLKTATEVAEMAASSPAITAAEFQAFEFVRDSGVTNMYDTGRVAEYARLTREQVSEIRRNYEHYVERYGSVRS